ARIADSAVRRLRTTSILPAALLLEMLQRARRVGTCIGPRKSDDVYDRATAGITRVQGRPAVRCGVGDARRGALDDDVHRGMRAGKGGNRDAGRGDVRGLDGRDFDREI